MKAPPPPQRTDTQVLEQVREKPSPGIPTGNGKKGTQRRSGSIIPALALAAVVALIAFDMYLDSAKREQAALEAATTEEETPPPEQEVKANPQPTPEPEVEAPKDEVPKETPKKKTPAPPKVAKAAADSGRRRDARAPGRLRRLDDEAVQRKFKLQVHALEGQVDDKGGDPAFVKKVQALHEQVKTALAKQQ